MKHFSLAENIPQGINGFIYEALGPYGTSELSDRALEEQMTDTGKPGFGLIEAEELFRATSHPDSQLPPEKWTTKTLERIKKVNNREQTQEEGETNQIDG